MPRYMVNLLRRGSVLQQVLPVTLAGPVTLKSPLHPEAAGSSHGEWVGVVTHPCVPGGPAHGQGGTEAVSNHSLHRVLSRVEGDGRHISPASIRVPTVWSRPNYPTELLYTLKLSSLSNT